MKKVINIYQLPIESDFIFRDLDYVEHVKPMEEVFKDYYLVYTSTEEMPEKISTMAFLDLLFTKYNTNRPSDYRGHSLSVSDIIEYDGFFYYINSFGFKKLNFNRKTVGDVLNEAYKQYMDEGNLIENVWMGYTKLDRFLKVI